MTAQQQLDALGISARADDGLVVIEMEQPVTAFTPAEIRRFHLFLERAYRDAHQRDRARGGKRVSI